MINLKMNHLHFCVEFLDSLYLFFHLTHLQHVCILHVKGELIEPLEHSRKSSSSLGVIHDSLTRLTGWIIHATKLDVGLRRGGQLHLCSGLCSSQLKC